MRAPGQRAGLTRDAVFAAARDLLAQDGLDGLTMRALARRLEVAPNALYSHTKSKAQLLDDLLDATLAAVEAPDPQEVEDPIAGLRAIMSSTFTVLTARAELVPVYVARQGARGPNAIRLGETMDTLLARTGLSGSAVGEARRVLIVYTIGFAAFAMGAALDGPNDTPLSLEQMARNFDRGLGWLLAGAVRG